MRILSVGTFNGLSNTCLLRHWALKKVTDIVDEVNTSATKPSIWFRIAYHLFLWDIPVRLPEKNGENSKIKKAIEQRFYDLVWIDKGTTICPETLKYIKKASPQTKIISYSPDNMALRHNQSQQYLECIPLYDYIITNKSYILDDMHKLGAKNVCFVNNSYETTFHHPYKLTKEEQKKFGSEVCFIGAWEQERFDSILHLVNNGIKVTVFGGGKWLKYKNEHPNLIIMGYSLIGEDYCKAICAAKISLCFLRKMNFDKQTTRSVEIPACGGFMLAERTDEHLSLFEEDKEAVFFSNNDELLEKCRYYLSHEDERNMIAIAGRERCVKSDYSNEGMIRRVLNKVLQDE